MSRQFILRDSARASNGFEQFTLEELRGFFANYTDEELNNLSEAPEFINYGTALIQATFEEIARREALHYGYRDPHTQLAIEIKHELTKARESDQILGYGFSEDALEDALNVKLTTLGETLAQLDPSKARNVLVVFDDKDLVDLWRTENAATTFILREEMHARKSKVPVSQGFSTPAAPPPPSLKLQDGASLAHRAMSQISAPKLEAPTTRSTINPQMEQPIVGATAIVAPSPQRAVHHPAPTHETQAKPSFSLFKALKQAAATVATSVAKMIRNKEKAPEEKAPAQIKISSPTNFVHAQKYDAPHTSPSGPAALSVGEAAIMTH